jgi:galactitol-specific phosphotransferase system IIB component
LGFYQASRLNSTQVLMQKNSTQTTVSTTSTTPTNANIILLATTTTLQFSDRQLQLVVIGEGLTADEMNSMKTINDNYKTSLGR